MTEGGGNDEGRHRVENGHPRDYNHRTRSRLSTPPRPPCLQKFSVPDCLA